MPLISLKPGKSKSFCENRFCNRRLPGKFKILRRGLKGYAFHVCPSCFALIEKKGGPDKYLPGRETPDIRVVGPVTGVHANDHARFVDATPKEGAVKIVQNTRTGQIIL